MKANTLLLLASLAVLASSASAAANCSDSNIHVLPTYVVTAPRHEPVELKVQASLQELRAQAAVPARITPELPMQQARTAQAEKLVEALRASGAKIIAKS